VFFPSVYCALILDAEGKKKEKKRLRRKKRESEFSDAILFSIIAHHGRHREKGR